MDVDYKVMLTFLEFYEVLIKFINFKLFSQINIQYPLEIDNSLESASFFSYKSLILKNENKNGLYINTILKTYKNVSQFWTYDSAKFLAQPVYSRDYPASKYLE